MDEEIEKLMDPDLVMAFHRDMDTDWKYVEFLYQAFKQRFLLEQERDKKEQEVE